MGGDSSTFLRNRLLGDLNDDFLTFFEKIRYRLLRTVSSVASVTSAATAAATFLLIFLDLLLDRCELGGGDFILNVDGLAHLRSLISLLGRAALGNSRFRSPPSTTTATTAPDDHFRDV